jgi:hypothetical protein
MYIPPDEYDAFLEAYSNALQRNERMYMVELRTSPLFKWHADLDMLTSQQGNREQILSIVREIQTVIADHFQVSGKNKVKILVLNAEPKSRDDGIKTGLHLVAPNLNVTIEDCLEIQKKSIRRLADIPLVNTWEEAFDTSVYKGNGLRMLGSRKMELCKCKGGMNCLRCNGTNKIDIGRPYVVSFVLDGSGVVDETATEHLKKRFALAVKMSSIKSFETLQRDIPRPSVIAVEKISKRKLETEALPDELDILGMLSYHLHPSFATAELVNMVKNPMGVAFTVKGSKYCLNVGREHSSSNIYFFLSSSGELTQRCHCQKYACNSFRSVAIRVSSALLKQCKLTTPSGLPLAFLRPLPGAHADALNIAEF